MVPVHKVVPVGRQGIAQVTESLRGAARLSCALQGVDPAEAKGCRTAVRVRRRDVHIVTTDAQAYWFAGGRAYPVEDP
jgi:hypothetical protein